MQANAKTITAVKDVFNRHGSDPIQAACMIQAIALLHGAEATLSALTQIHIVTAAHLKALRRRENIAARGYEC